MKTGNEKLLTEEEIKALAEQGLEGANWFAAFRFGDVKPCAVFDSDGDADDFKYANVLIDRIEPWPMLTNMNARDEGDQEDKIRGQISPK